MFLDDLIKKLRAPLDAIRGKQSGVANFKGGIKGDIGRLKQVGESYKQGVAEGTSAVKGAKGHVQGAQQSGATLRTPQVGKKRKKMSLFSKKKKCPSCGAKMHVSWDQCPDCGYSESAAPVAAPSPSGGGSNRTMALDTGGGGGGAPSNNVGWLVPLEGAQAGELFTLKHRCVVGTAPDCDVVLRDGSISGRHAEFIATGGGYRINDLGSTNGTFVNDKRVTSHDLVDNDNVRLGRTAFKFKSMN
jgi:ribosomal protein L37E